MLVDSGWIGLAAGELPFRMVAKMAVPVGGAGKLGDNVPAYATKPPGKVLLLGVVTPEISECGEPDFLRPIVIVVERAELTMGSPAGDRIVHGEEFHPRVDEPRLRHAPPMKSVNIH